MKLLREQLEHYGATSLSTEGLLTLVLRTSPGSLRVVERIHTLLTTYDRLQDVLQVDFGQLCHEYGFGKAKAAQVQALLELARRLTLPSKSQRYQITCAQHAADLLMPEMAHLDHEEMRVLLLDTKNYMVAHLLLYQGTVDCSVLRVAELFRPAITRKCPHLLVCHNHPSGDPAPSPEDIAVTKQIVEAGKLLDIEVLDHLIIGQYRFVSLKEQMQWE
jgi:DNA repair protein RadC